MGGGYLCLNIYKGKTQNPILMENKRVFSENQRELKKKEKLAGMILARDLLWEQSELYNVLSAFLVPPKLYDILLLPEIAPAETVARHSRSPSFLCHPDKGESKVSFKILAEA